MTVDFTDNVQVFALFAGSTDTLVNSCGPLKCTDGVRHIVSREEMRLKCLSASFFLIAVPKNRAVEKLARRLAKETIQASKDKWTNDTLRRTHSCLPRCNRILSGKSTHSVHPLSYRGRATESHDPLYSVARASSLLTLSSRRSLNCRTRSLAGGVSCPR